MADNETKDSAFGAVSPSGDDPKPNASHSRPYVLSMTLCVLAAVGAALLPLVSGWTMSLLIGAQVACAIAGGIFLGLSISKARAWNRRSDPVADSSGAEQDATLWLPSRDGAGQ